MPRRLPRSLELLAWIALGLPCLAQSQTRILLDGRFDDWAGVPPAAGSLRITNDERRLLMSLELGRELLIQEANRLEMSVDGDGDPETGCRSGEVGAELIWSFGARRGTLCHEGRETSVQHQAVGLMTAPTVSSSRFEIVLERRPGPGIKPIFTSERVTVRFSGEGAPDLPVDYEFRDGQLPAVAPRSFGRLDPNHLRLLSHNLNGRLLSSPSEVFAQVYSAIDADVYLFQEIRGTPPQRVEELLRTWVPSLAGKTLHSATAGLDGSRGRDTNVLVSPLPILESRHLGGSGVFLLDLGAPGDSRLLLVVLSLPCCSDHAGRDEQIDQIHAFLRESRAGRGPMPLPNGAPILLMGDANLVGPASQAARLLDGAIAAPDWDGTAFRDLEPRHLQAPLTFTWYGVERQGYSPGRLDYVIYSDSVLEIPNAFVLHTPEMSAEALAELGLESGDTLALSHHLPVVVDLELPE